MNKRQIKIAVLTETKKKGSGTDSMKDYVTIYSGVPKTNRAAAGVMICVHKSYRDKIVNYNICHERIISVRIKMGERYITVIGTYAPEEGRNEESNEFYENLQNVTQSVNNHDYKIIAGDLNAKVGDRRIGKTVGTFGTGEKNENGKKLIDYCIYNQLRILNTFFRHKELHKITWQARGSHSTIDYIISSDEAAKACSDVRAYRSYDIGTDHFLVQAKFQLPSKNIPKKEDFKKQRLNVRSLDDPTTRWLYQRRLDIIAEEELYSDDIETEWNTIVRVVDKAAKESLGMIRVRRPEKRIRNWSPEMKQLVEEKRKAFRKWMSSRKVEDKVEYNKRSALVKRKARELQRESWDNFTTFLEQETYKLRPKTYKIIRRIDSNFNERVQLPKLRLEDAKAYYTNLWKEAAEEQRQKQPPEDEGNVAITYAELEEAMKKCKNARAPGEDGIAAELFKYASIKFKKRLLKIYNNMWKKETIPKNHRTAVVLPIFKKGDMSKAENYRGISLLNTGYKIYTKILTQKLTEIAEEKLLECQNGFRKGRSCTDASFTIKLLMEKRIEYSQEMHMCFIDFEKAYDNVNRNKLFSALEEYNIPKKLIRAIESLYEDTMIRVKIGEEMSECEKINKGVRQGCPLSCILFNIYMDKIIRQWKATDPKGVKITNTEQIETLLFADDQVIVAENEDELQRSVFKLEKIAKEYGMKISTAKTKVIAFRGKEQKRSKIVVNGRIIEQVGKFRYLGVDISSEGEVDVQSKISKFLKITGLINKILRHNKTTRETRLRVYNTLAVPMLTYGSETWALRKTDKKRIEAAEMRYLRRTAGLTLRDRKRSEEIRNFLKTTPLTQRIKTYRKKWREHVGRMEEHRSPKTVLKYTPRGKRPTGRPRQRILDTSGSSEGTDPGTPPQTGH